MARSLEPGEALRSTSATRPRRSPPMPAMGQRRGVAWSGSSRPTSWRCSGHEGRRSLPEPSRLPGPSVLEMVFAGLRRDSARRGPYGTSDVTTSPDGQPQSGNLLINSGAEAGDPSLSGYASVSIPGWTVTGTPTVIQYGTLRRLPGLFGTERSDVEAILRVPQRQPCTGGQRPAVLRRRQRRHVNTHPNRRPHGRAVRGRRRHVVLRVERPPWSLFLDGSAATVKVNFLDAHDAYLGSGSIGPVMPA